MAQGGDGSEREGDAPGVTTGTRSPQVVVTARDASLRGQVRAWLVRQGSTPVADGAALRLEGEGENGSWELALEPDETRRQVVAVSTWPQDVPPERLPEVQALLERLNQEPGGDAFAVTCGRVALRSTVDVAGEDVDAVLAPLLGRHVAVFDDHLPTLLDVLEGPAPQRRA